MSQFKAYSPVSVGDNQLGPSPYGTVSVLCVGGAAGTLGVVVEGVFIPHPDGAMTDGQMLTFEVGRGRVLGFNATSGGKLAITEV